MRDKSIPEDVYGNDSMVSFNLNATRRQGTLPSAVEIPDLGQGNRFNPNVLRAPSFKTTKKALYNQA